MSKVRPERLEEPKPDAVPKPSPEPPAELTDALALRREAKAFMKMLSAVEPGKAREILRAATNAAMSDPMTRQAVKKAG